MAVVVKLGSFLARLGGFWNTTYMWFGQWETRVEGSYPGPMEMILENKTNVKLNYFLPTSPKIPTRICCTRGFVTPKGDIGWSLIHYINWFTLVSLRFLGFGFLHQLCKVVIFDLEFSWKPIGTSWTRNTSKLTRICCIRSLPKFNEHNNRIRKVHEKITPIHQISKKRKIPDHQIFMISSN
jgi:hypothetical protein